MHSLSLGAYVLAGGRSTRMGQDKALLPLAGRPLVEHAVSKLRHLTDEVYILADRRELAAFAPIVPDLRQGCGPLGGFETALSHTRREWCDPSRGHALCASGSASKLGPLCSG